MGMSASEKVILELLKQAGGATRTAAEKVEKEMEEEERKHEHQ